MTWLSLYYHTLRHLKWQQIYRRLWFRVVRPRVDKSPRPTLQSVHGAWVSPARRKQSLLDEDGFFFLNQSGRLSEFGWDGPQREKLWRYNQHYFDDLNAQQADERSIWHRDLLVRWVVENKPGTGTGWEPYPTSLRIVNWIKWELAGNSLSHDCLQSLAVQARWLIKRLEWHLLGNHLFANAKALVFAGLVFDGSEAQRWLGQGLKIISSELPEQVLPDGGNFERSPMYHAIFLEDLLDLLNLARAYPGAMEAIQFEQLWGYTEKMLGWLKGMCHPDGEIAFFNDAAVGIAPGPDELFAYAGRMGFEIRGKANSPPVQQFPSSGYVRLQDDNVVALLDVAPIGPDYLPGHAHADTLSFELSLFGRRVFVNGGTSEYSNGATRLKERGTATHSTVQINGQNSSELWGGFRVARRAYPFGLKVEETLESVSVCCAHDGYCRLPGKPVHWRKWHLSRRRLVVCDHVEGPCKSAVARFHLHPAVQFTDMDEGVWRLRLPGGQQVMVEVEEGKAKQEPGFYAPEFGKRMSATVIAVELGPEGSVVRISW